MTSQEIMSAIFLIAVLFLVLPTFLSSNNRINRFFKNISIWAVIVLVIVIIINLIK